jgi:hypothetical protein
LCDRSCMGPKGEKRGALLEDGRIVRMPPHTAESLHDKLAPGHKLAARGDGLTNALGTVVAAKEIGVSLTALHPVEAKKPGPHDEAKPPKHDEAFQETRSRGLRYSRRPTDAANVRAKQHRSGPRGPSNPPITTGVVPIIGS